MVSVSTPPSERGRWGLTGHAIVHREAMEHLPDSMPDFFTQAEDRIVSMASLPDRWKVPDLGYLKSSSVPDHHFNYEFWGAQDLPADRFGAVVKADEGGLSAAASGMLPYRVAELYQSLTADFALWRNEVDHNGADTPTAQQYQEDAIHDAGMIGHFVGDASQPLHATVHHDGWALGVPNPHHYRTWPGLHRQYETLLVNAAVDEADVAGRVGPTTVLTGDPLQMGMGFIAESNGQVERLYQLEQDGKLDPDHPSPEGVDFAEERLAKGATNLRDVWYSAWVASEDLAHKLDGHGPELTTD